MAKYTFESDLSVKRIENLQKELLNYKNNILQRKLQMLVDTLAEKGVEIAKAKIKSYNAVFTSELINSIHSENGGTQDGTAIFFIVADSKHAMFVEYGTGQMGQEMPYPGNLPSGWNYNEGETIFEVSPGQYGWIYYRDGKFYFTQGMPSRPFMYETSLELYRIVEKTAKEVFRGK